MKTGEQNLLKNSRESAFRGSALIAILWVIAILSLAVFSAAHFLFVELEAESNASALFQAELLANRGIALASHAKVSRGDPVLLQEVGNGASFETRISSEGDRLPLNALLQRPGADRVVLEGLFLEWGIRQEVGAAIVDNLIDWVDADDLPTNLGAETSYYLSQNRATHPFNRPFRSLEEVPLVKDFEMVMRSNPDWRTSFTLLSSGELDLNEAPGELIAATCQCSPETARLFVLGRTGFDGIAGTEDDIVYESVEEALAQLGVPQESSEIMAGRLSVNDPVKRIISIGRYGGLAVERSLSIQYTGNRGKILQWTSRRTE